jgi:ribonuclease HI
MGWVRAEFRGQKVWAEVDEAGQPRVVGGRRQIRYSDAAGAKLYGAGASGVRDAGGPVQELAPGTAAEPSSGGSAGSGGARSNARGSGFGSAGSRTAGQAAAAADDARTRIAALPADTILAFTDGACKGNPGPAGSGLVVKLPDGRRVERHRALGQATNNVGELTAIGMALEVLAELDVPPRASVAVFSDSDYAVKVLTLNWKAKANVELIAGIKAALKARPGVKLHWVAGHVGIPENEQADALARRGVEESRGRR